jgi:dienelactone hydrolase
MADGQDLDDLLIDDEGRPLMAKFLPSAERGVGLLAVFPGKMYSADAPLFKGIIDALARRSWEIMVASYEPVRRGEDEIVARARLALERLIPARGPAAVALAGKSLGTPYVARVCLGSRLLSTARVAYLTPLLGNPAFDEAFARSAQPAYVAIGTADPFYDRGALSRLRAARPFELTVIEGADHGMNVLEDAEASARAVEQVVGEVVKFFTN